MPYPSTVDSGQNPPWYLAWEGNIATLTGGASANTASKIYAVGIWVPSYCVVTGMRAALSPSGNGNFDLGIYDASGTNGSPGNLLGNIGKQTSTTGNTAIALSGGNLSLSPGRYYLAGWVDNTTDHWYQVNAGGSPLRWVNAYISTSTSSTGLTSTFAGSSNGVALCLQAAIQGGL